MTNEDLKFALTKQLKINQECFETRVEPDIIIGCDHIAEIWRGDFIQLPSGILLIKTVFGYTTMGKNTKWSKPLEMDSTISVMNTVVKVQNDDIEFLQQQETIMHAPNEYTGAVVDEKLEMEKKTTQFFNNTIEKRENGYHVRLPFKEEVIDKLPSNFAIAKKRLQSGLKANPQVKKLVNDVFEDQISKNILEEVDVSKDTEGMRIHYNPHSPVLTPQKTTTKCRVVIDGSAHFKNEPSLNDAIYQGPTILPDSVDTRFRSGKTVLLADVEKAFLQVHLNESDRDVTRVLWVKNPDLPPTRENLRVLRFTRVLFGLNVSPFLLGATILFHLDRMEDKKLANTIARNLYVDNLIIATDDDSEAMFKLYNKVKTVFNGLSMNIREFQSNDQSFTDLLDECDKTSESEVKVLGVKWSTKTDQITSSTTDIDILENSRRTVSSAIASIYDPMGLLVPLLLPLKLFQRKLWIEEEKYGWDTPLKEKHEKEYKSITDNIRGFSKDFNRHIIDKSGENEIIAFADASQEAIAACIYVKNKYGVNLLFGKSNVKSLKEKWTIPKLEVQALKVATDRALSTLTALQDGDIKVTKVILFSDSEITLAWLRSEPGKKEVGILIKNRIESIRKTNETMLQKGVQVFFGYVNTLENPADLRTRGLPKEDFQNSIWWKGPEYAKSDSSTWETRQKMFKINRTEAEMANINICKAIESEKFEAVFDINRTNSLPKMRRVAAYAFRAIKKMATKLPRPRQQKMEKAIPELTVAATGNPPITAAEHQWDEKRLIREHQANLESKDLRKWSKLNIQLVEGLARCKGRLFHMSPDIDISQPVFIMPQSQLAKLLIWEAHGKYHTNEQQTMEATREKAWIPCLRRQVKKIIGKCVKCQRYNRAPMKYPNMADMPSFRVRRSRPFENTGLDYFGPMTFRKEDGSTESCWGCVLSCATTRLTHIELVQQCSTKAFINAIRRFVSERGIPDRIVSDNAPQFWDNKSSTKYQQGLPKKMLLTKIF